MALHNLVALLSLLHHNHSLLVLTTHDIADGECVLVFPYYEHDLSGLLSENRLSLPQVKCYLRQLLLGLQDMHKCGFMHRDIKGSHILSLHNVHTVANTLVLSLSITTSTSGLFSPFSSNISASIHFVLLIESLLLI
jgi:serine/threonine protein kinase